VTGRCQQARLRALRHDELATTATADPDNDGLGNGPERVSIGHMQRVDVLLDLNSQAERLSAV
jgi:hypothetical protein